MFFRIAAASLLEGFLTCHIPRFDPSSNFFTKRVILRGRITLDSKRPGRSSPDDLVLRKVAVRAWVGKLPGNSESPASFTTALTMYC